MIGNAFLLALRELRRNLLRSFLTMLGIIIGVAAVIVMVTLGGGATRQVTGSCYLLETAHSRVLIECGLFQGPPDVDRLNERPFPFKPRDIHSVVLSHAHLDHSGLLPRLKREGFDGKVYATTQALELLDIMLKDAAHIQEKDTEWENRRRERSGKELIAPLYTLQDAEDVLTVGEPLVYGKKLRISQDIEI